MSPAKRKTEIITLFVLADILAITAGFFAAFHFRFLTGILPVTHGVPNFTPYGSVLMVVLPVYLWFFKKAGLYESRRSIRRIEEIFLVMKGVSYAVVTLMAMSFLYRALTYSRVYLITLWIFTILSVSLTRYLLIQWEYYRKKQKKDLSRVLVIGADHNARAIVQWAQGNPHYGQEVIGILAHDSALIGKHIEDVGIIGPTADAERFIEQLKPDIVILVDSSFTKPQITELVATCEEQLADFKVAADFYGLMTRGVDVEYISRVPLLGFKPLPLDYVWNRVAKRLFDIAVTLVLIILSSPFWILAAVLVKLDDGGPVLYSQERVGRDQKVFKVLKFRTMKVDAEKETGPVWAKQNDNRRTRTGDFFRRWNIDELPQFLNVLTGDMTLVGPRPERPHFVNQFRETIPRYMTRHKIKSGITGWAQVNGYRGNTSIHERIKYDLYYMEHWSLLFDMKILFMTIFAYKNAY